jgi:hypothetical protein
MDFDQPRSSSDDEQESEEDSPRGILALDYPRKVLFSLPIEIRINELRRWEPRMDSDQPKDLTDDE